MRRSTPKPEYLRRLEHRRHRLDDRLFPMSEGRAASRLAQRIKRLEVRIDKVRAER